MALAAWVDVIVAPIASGAQLVGLSMKPERSMLTLTLLQPQRHAADDLRQRIGHDRDVRVGAVDLDRGANERGTEVKRSGHGGHDDREPERRARVGPVR